MPVQQRVEREILVRAIAGDAAAFADLVHAYEQSVFNLAYRLVGQREDAEDLAQAAFVRAYRARHSFDLNRAFEPWLYRIATNVCLTFLKRRGKRAEPLEDAEIADARQEVEAPTLARERAAQVRQAMLGLPAELRVVLELRHYQDLAYNEIAETLNLSLDLVKVRLFRARKQLRQTLRAVGFEA